jgi:hypothetical protein
VNRPSTVLPRTVSRRLISAFAASPRGHSSQAEQMVTHFAAGTRVLQICSGCGRSTVHSGHQEINYKIAEGTVYAVQGGIS